jgi:hypothetical protein
MSSYWYLGSPYSRFPGGITAAFDAVCFEAGRLIAAGVPVYSPIAHTHPIALAAKMDPHSRAIWMPVDRPMMDGARGLIVLMLAGWNFSEGLRQEQQVFRAANKPIRYLLPGFYLSDIICELLNTVQAERTPGLPVQVRS